MAKKNFAAGMTKTGVLNNMGGEKLKEMQAKTEYNFQYIPKEKIISNPKNEKYSQDSQFYLGRAYEEGKGVLKDLEKAKSYYRMAAGKGQVEAKKALERLGE